MTVTTPGGTTTGVGFTVVVSVAFSPSTITWSAATALPQALFAHGAVVVRNWIYVAGGNGADGNPVKAVYTAKLKADGTLEAWTTNSTGPRARQKFTATVAGSYVLVSGGLYGGAASGSSEEQYASINSDGSLGSFGGAGGNITVGYVGGCNPYNHSNAFFADSSGTPHVIVLGGTDVGTGTPHNGIYICTQ